MSHRPAQIAGVIRTTVAEFSLQIPPNVAKVVSVTDVKLSPDFSYADIFISAMDGTDAAVKNLASRQGEIKKNLSRKLRVFKLPILRFQRDIEGERGTRLDELLEKLGRDSAAKEKRTAAPTKKPRKKRA